MTKQDRQAAAVDASDDRPTGPSQVLAFWFGAGADGLADEDIAERQAGLWWAKDDAVDAEIRERFGGLVEAAAAGGLDAWRNDAAGWLALLIAADQLPRNMFRDAPGAFALDPLAREVCAQGLAAGLDRMLRPIHRVFAYLPLEHAEDIALQRAAVDRFRSLVEDVPEAARKTFEGFLEFALRHQAVIERFGRFPHRNAILGRESTAEELHFLGQPGSSF